ncbi:tyrosine-type recombinase/integrase [Nocardiopsis sp. LOL_012]|uniref:tyrosine-type recombinase/integrase n=1 Tax=Nocardiopsis sp. LOL_012 TaxID=3345409 RepID=UPI003A84C5A2
MPKIKKRCWCIDRETGKVYREGRCPRLKEKRHGSYWFRLEAPSHDGTSRRQPRFGPYPTLQEAKDARAKEVQRIHGGDLRLSPKMLYRDYLEKRWLENKKHLKSWSDYEEIVRLYAIPGLGHVKVGDLNKDHFLRLAEEIRRINRKTKGGKRESEMLLRLLAVRAERADKDGGKKRYSTRPISLARLRKIMAVLRSSMSYLVKAGTLTDNPADNLPIPTPRRHKPLIWTEGRVARWRSTGKKPAKIMVWTPEQSGDFLDRITGHRLYPLFHLVLLTGLRRSEVIGLQWAEVDLDKGWMMVREAITAPDTEETREEDEEDLWEEDLWEEAELERLGTKSEAGERYVSLSRSTVAVLRAWKRTQNTERLKAGRYWNDTGLVFTRPDGRQVHPHTLAHTFDQLIRRHGMPPITFHGMRHSSATAQLAAGIEPKVISQTLGHSRTSFTMDTYVHVAPEAQRGAAEATDAAIPRSAPAYGTWSGRREGAG